MNYWTIWETAFIPSDHELLQRFPNAVSHDGKNTVFVAAPSDLTNAIVVPPDMIMRELIDFVGQRLTAEMANPIVCTKEQLEILFHTPEHRLWCAKYENASDPGFIADKEEVGLDAGMDIATAKTSVRASFVV